MPPSALFSHFRPHRRAGSSPSSPQPNQSPSASPAFSPPPPLLESPLSTSSLSHSWSPVTSAPPVLPPIPRVASQKKGRADREDVSEVRRDHAVSGKGSSRPLTMSTPPVLPPIHRVSSRDEAQQEHDRARTSASDDFLEEKRKLSEPSLAQHPERLSQAMTKARASFADFGRAYTSPMVLAQLDSANTMPKTPSSSSRKDSSDAPPFLHPHPRHGSSPSSSISSFQKTASSTNLAAVEASPASSRSAQGMTERGPATVRQPKTKLNLLNPVSLLKRRRTSQGLESISDTPVAPARSMDLPVMRLPADYDPRIKGKGIHNFDAEPRPKRNWSSNDMPGMALQDNSNTSDGKRRSSIPALGKDGLLELGIPYQEKEHAPVFVENFEEDEESGKDGPSAVQRESLANSSFLARMSKQLDFDALDFSVPPVRAKSPSEPLKSLPAIPQQPSQTQPPANQRSSRNTDNSSFRISSDQSTARSSVSNDTKATSPPQSPNVQIESRRSTRSLEPPFQPSRGLSHLPSTASHASRFSFQLNSDHCIEQEKALEDKGKQKQASRDSKHLSTADSRFEDFDEDDIDYDAMMDESGYGAEEDIPTTGEGYDDMVTTSGLNEQFMSTYNTLGINMGSNSQITRASSMSRYTETPNEGVRSPSLEDSDHAEGRAIDAVPPALQTVPVEEPTSDFDDMYFDDGIIEAATSGNPSLFDESAFDSPVRTKFNESTSSEDFPTPKRRTTDRSLWTDRVTDDIEEESHPIDNSDLFSVGQREATPTNPRDTRAEEDVPATLSAPAGGLNAYHSALAEAASKAAGEGRFQRQSSILTASSIYSSNASLQEQAFDTLQEYDEDLPGSRLETFEDTDDDDDPLVAAANAEVLGSEDSDIYNQEFGFFSRPVNTGDGLLHNGGYFGQPNLLGASLRDRQPAMTPISERTEISARNSIVGSTPWGPPSSGPWGTPSAAGLTSPGLKDLAASMGMDDDDMTLGQLLKLRKEAFGGGGSGPQSAQPSSSSSDNSPISQHNPSPLAHRGLANSAMGASFASLEGQRRLSELELPNVDEVPEHMESGEDSGAQDSPISENVTLGTARAVLAQGKHTRRGSAELLAQEYTSLVDNSDSPVPIIAAPVQPTPQTSPRQEQEAFSPVTVAGRSSPPTIASPKPQRKSMAPATMPVAAGAGTVSPLSFSGTKDDVSAHTSVPTPPMAMMQKFASRPAPDGYRKSSDPSNFPQARRRSSGGDGELTGTSSVAYVREIDDDGVEKWFLEKRRQKSTGELIVIGREPVQGGRI